MSNNKQLLKKIYEYQTQACVSRAHYLGIYKPQKEILSIPNSCEWCGDGFNNIYFFLNTPTDNRFLCNDCGTIVKTDNEKKDLIYCFKIIHTDSEHKIITGIKIIYNLMDTFIRKEFHNKLLQWKKYTIQNKINNNDQDQIPPQPTLWAIPQWFFQII